VHGLEEELVAMDLLFRRLLERQELVRPQIALIVARARSGENRLGVVLDFARCFGARHEKSILPSRFSAYELESRSAVELLPVFCVARGGRAASST
jgi:hypothetical protein